MTESSLSTTELEMDLFNLLNKIRQKKIESQNFKNSNTLSVSVKNFYDLREFLQNIKNMKENILQEKNKEKDELTQLSEKIRKHIEKNQNDLNKIKDFYDKIIQKTNSVSKDLNTKQSELMIAKSDYEVVKNDYEKLNEVLSDKIKKNFLVRENSDSRTEDKISQKFLHLNKKISNLNKSLTERNNLQAKILKLEENSKKSEIESVSINKIQTENKMDGKFFHLIEENILSNLKQMRSEEFNSTVLITTLNKIVNDKENLKKLEGEKFQLNEMYKDTYANIKKLLSEHEEVQYEVNNLMKKKNKLKEEISAKEIEENLKMSKVKKEISELKMEIKSTRNKMSENLKNQKDFLVSNEIKIKNLIVVLNNLMVKVKNKNRNFKSDGFLNELLFDNKVIDVDSEVSDDVIKEINNSISGEA